MIRTNTISHKSSEDIKARVKTRLAERIDKLFEQLPENSSVAEIEQHLLKESPELTSELFQSLVDRQAFSPYERAQGDVRPTAQRTQEK